MKIQINHKNHRCNLNILNFCFIGSGHISCFTAYFILDMTTTPQFTLPQSWAINPSSNPLKKWVDSQADTKTTYKKPKIQAIPSHYIFYNLQPHHLNPQMYKNLSQTAAYGPPFQPPSSSNSPLQCRVSSQINHKNPIILNTSLPSELAVSLPS